MSTTTTSRQPRTTVTRRLSAAVLACAVIGTPAATFGAATAGADPAAPINSRGYVIGPFTHDGCVTAANRNATYFRSHGGGAWDYTCRPGRGGWVYTSPYAA